MLKDVSSPLSATGRTRALFAALSLPIIGGAVTAMAAVSLSVLPVWGDQAWCAYVASRVLDGAHLGTDIVEVNPPTIIWMSEIPVILSRLIGVSLQTAMQICLGLLILLSVAWCASLVRRTARSRSGTMALWLAVSILYATSVYRWMDVGEREHIMVLLLLPYLVTAAIRLDGASPLRWQGFAAGSAALIALALKPHHLLIVVGVEFLLAYRHGVWRSFVRPEAVGAVFTGVIYCVAVWIFARDYINDVVPLNYLAYNSFYHVPIGALIVPGRTAKALAVLLLWALMERRLQYRALCAVLVIAAIGATVGYLIQEKGDPYQFGPADAYFIILVSVMLADGFIRWLGSPNQRLFQAWPAPAVALASFLLTAFLYFPVHLARAAATYDTDYSRPQVAVTNALRAGTAIMVLGPNAISFDLVLDRRLIWASRFYGFWTLEAIFDAQETNDAALRQARLAKLSDVVHLTRTAADEDLQRWKPSVVLVERCEDRSILCGKSEAMREIDVLQWFEEDPAFRRLWGKYGWCQRIGYYDVWVAKADQDTCRTLSSISAYTMKRPTPVSRRMAISEYLEWPIR